MQWNVHHALRMLSQYDNIYIPTCSNLNPPDCPFPLPQPPLHPTASLRLEDPVVAEEGEIGGDCGGGGEEEDAENLQQRHTAAQQRHEI